jgi:cytochrome c oxidase subunit 2
MPVDAEKFEKTFLVLSAAMLVVFLGALLFAAVGLGLTLPGRGGEIDPTEVAQTAPFDEPRLERTGPGRYRAVMTAQAWSFLPREIEVPAGSEVRFVMTSRDVIHGFHVEGTRINAMVIPGQITRVSHTFEEPGEHLVICHEYCGAGHHGMYATIRVTEAGDATGGADGASAGAGAGEQEDATERADGASAAAGAAEEGDTS